MLLGELRFCELYMYNIETTARILSLPLLFYSLMNIPKKTNVYVSVSSTAVGRHRFTEQAVLSDIYVSLFSLGPQ